MKKLTILIASSSREMLDLAASLRKSDMEVIICEPNPLKIQMSYYTNNAYAIIIEQDSFDYSELLDNLTANEIPPHIYLIKDPFSLVPAVRIPDSTYIHTIENMHRHSDIVNVIKLGALEAYKSEYISHTSIAEHAQEIVHRALSDLCFTANYTGSMYLNHSLVGLCLSNIKRSDSMCKIIYPYIAKKYQVTPSSVERSIRTVIKKCWGNSSDDVHVKYFGLVYSDSRDIPTNREFIMILGDSLIREVERFKSSLKINMVDDL